LNSEVRMDKWLWAARFFKTRALAAKACELGRVSSNGQPAKSARPVRVGDLLQVKNEGGDFQVEVLLLSDIRGPAAVAQTLYRETEASRALRLQQAEERKAMPRFEPMFVGKPSKRNRRALDRLRGRA
jgi:ribosome-associated heat shock protein Hsp15